MVDSGFAFCTFVDATKAFDRVDYCKLFRNYSNAIYLAFTYDCWLIYTQIMLLMCPGMAFIVKRSNVNNCVRQGGIVRPVRYSVTQCFTLIASCVCCVI